MAPQEDFLHPEQATGLRRLGPADPAPARPAVSPGGDPRAGRGKSGPLAPEDAGKGRRPTAAGQANTADQETEKTPRTVGPQKRGRRKRTGYRSGLETVRRVNGLTAPNLPPVPGTRPATPQRTPEPQAPLEGAPQSRWPVPPPRKDTVWKIKKPQLERPDVAPMLDEVARILADGPPRTSIDLLTEIARTRSDLQIGWTAAELDHALLNAGRFWRGGGNLWSLRQVAPARPAAARPAPARRAPATPAAARPTPRKKSPADEQDQIVLLGKLSKQLAGDSPPPGQMPFDIPLGKIVRHDHYRLGHRHPWGQLLRTLEDVMGDDAFHIARLTVHDPTGTPIARYAVDLTLLDEPRWVISTLVPTASARRLNHVAGAGWFMWADPNHVDWTKPYLLATDAHLADANRTRLAVYKTASKRSAARALVLAAHTDNADSSRVSLEVTLVKKQRAQKRRTWTRQVTAALPRRPRGAVLANCAVCGLPLTTKGSAIVGIGPTCLARLRETAALPPDIQGRDDVLGAINRATVPISYWARAIPARRWAATLGKRLRID